MDRIIYTAAGGAARVLEHQTVLSNNIANAATTGFREQLAHYRSVPVVADQTLPTRVGTVTATPGSNFESGAAHYTGSPLHAAIAGEGWFSVQAQNGEEAYTRSGEFAVGADNMLVTQLGLPVMSVDGAPIEVPERGSITIASDGTITALGAGDNPADIQNIGQLKLVNPPPETMVRGDDGLFRVGGDQPIPQADPTVKLSSGFLEGSNVNTAHNMVALISNARQFELQMKVIQDASTNAERANSILSINS